MEESRYNFYSIIHLFHLIAERVKDTLLGVKAKRSIDSTIRSSVPLSQKPINPPNRLAIDQTFDKKRKVTKLTIKRGS